MFVFYNGPYSGMKFATMDRLFTATSDRIQYHIIKGHTFD